MRTLTVLSAIVLFPALAFSQNIPLRGYCFYGCGPYVPLITTPSISFETVSPNPVGATNATGGLVTGATNSTLSQITYNTSAVYTLPVWYAGGGMPLISPAVNVPIYPSRMEAMERMYRRERMYPERETERKPWTYFSSLEETTSAAAVASTARAGRKAGRTYTNQDVERQNQQNGSVKYDGKSEKIQ